MGEPLNEPVATLPLAVVCQRMASLILGARPAGDASVGDVTLWPHQRDAVARVRMAIEEFNGALLADDVGTGKTFIALAIASRYDSPLIVAPAGLRDGWRRAAERAGRVLPFASFESLSRGRALGAKHDFVIVDEAHHCRNPRARRYHALAALLVHAPALLLSATPIHNRRDDLLALLALFLGAGARTLDDAAIARCIVRRDRGVLADNRNVPRIVGAIPIVIGPFDDATPDAILALPPPVPAADAGTAGGLLVFSLLRQWASSQGALLAAIRRRLAVAHALAATLDDGRYPTRAEVAAWTLGDDAQQLALSSLLSPAQGPPPRAELREAVAAHTEGLRVIRRAALANPDIDRVRAARLRETWAAHPGERSIAFSQFAETIEAYWRELRAVPGTCALTARGARIAGGRIARSEALGSFRPGRSGPPGSANHISALLTTDLASEGLDLHDASVLIHLDLPWTPARLEQRVGRIVRPGSPHPIVHLYAMEPPVQAARLLDIHERLASKLASARATLGEVMPTLGVDVGRRPTRVAPPTAAEDLEMTLRRWRLDFGGSHDGLRQNSAGTGPDDRGPSAALPVAVARGMERGWLAVIGEERVRFVCSLGEEIGEDPRLTVEVCRAIEAVRDSGDLPAAAHGLAVARAKGELRSWLDARRGAALAGVGEIAAIHGRRRTLAAIAALSDAPASARVALAASAQRALATAGGTLAAGSERLLFDLGVESATARGVWLDAIARVASRRAPGLAGPRDETIRALLVLTAER